MQRIGFVRAAGLALCLICAFTAAPAPAGAAPDIRQAVEAAVDAYIFGYPLVTFDRVRQQQTNVAVPDAEHAPMGQMIKMRSYPAVDNHCCAAPNADTLYTEAWLDVSKEPWILGIPDMGDRYFIVPLLDGWSNVFHVASPPTTGGKAQTYAITGPGWSGNLPDGVVQVKSPTAMVWVLGRIYCTGTPEDYAAVHALQDRFSLVPLSSYGRAYEPGPAAIDAGFDMKTAIRKQVDGLSTDDYFNALARLMKTNPPPAADAAMVARLASIGIVPGQDFDPKKLSFLDRELFKAVPKLALLKMARRLKQQPTTNGWLYFTSGVGVFGTDYLLRATANALGPGWNRPQDAVYPLSQQDGHGSKYDGRRHDYLVHFDKGQLPPAKAFWSLTMYDPSFFFVSNLIDRYELSQRDSLAFNPDGSVDFYLQAKSPGNDKESNWLPAPAGKFALVLRLYWPADTPPSILDGTWKPPAVRRVR